VTEKITLPRPRFPEKYVVDPNELTAKRYGTLEMVQIWGAEKTFEYSLRSQGQAAMTLSRLYPRIVPKNIAEEIKEKASLKYIKPDRIRFFEAKFKHDIVGLNTALEEVLSDEAKPYVNLARTSADTTESAKALQIMDGLEVIASTVENVRDITLEKAKSWIKVPYMVNSHGLDSLPSLAGRPLVHYAELLQSDLEHIKSAYDNSTIGKWGDATGDHHSAKSLGIDGLKLQEEYCKDLGIGFSVAPAQTPGLEYQADVIYALTRTGATLDNLARFIADGKGADVDVFRDANPKKRKGSSAMPHKDIKGGNPATEEQEMSLSNYMEGCLTTALANCQMRYARDLSASANMRIILESGFKFFDHATRNLANVIYWTDINEKRSRERVARSFGVVTSEQVLTHLTNNASNPMPRSEAHNLVALKATDAYNTGMQFFDVLIEDKEITDRIDRDTLLEITDPFKFVGESEKIIETVYQKYHGKKTFE
jgi:adenylosuccinate lyase